MILTLTEKGKGYTRISVNRCRELHYRKSAEGWLTDDIEPCELNKLSPQAKQELIERMRNHAETAFYLD